MESLIGLLGGLALFIFGMQMMSNGLKNAAGDRLQSILEQLTGNTFLGVTVGAGVTALIQSSTATSVMVVGFVNAGLMTLKQAMAVIMGANVGTTVTSQIIAFNISRFVLPIIIVGFLLHFLSQRPSLKYTGSVILGFGILMHGMGIMATAMQPLQADPAFTSLMARFSAQPWLALLFGIGATVLLQSSSATTGLLIALAASGLIDLQGAIPVLLGTNVGTCVSALLSSIGTTRGAKRAALGHILFNVFGALLFMAFLGPFTRTILSVSGSTASVPRLIANSHLAFNLVTTAVSLPLINQFVSLILHVLPELEEERELNRNPVYLDDRVLSTPEIALSLARKELLSIGRLAEKGFRNAFTGLIEKKPKRLRKVFEAEPIIDKLEKETTTYLAKIAQQNISERLSEANSALFHVAYDMERIGDHAENIAQIGMQYLDGRFCFSDKAVEELHGIYDLTMDCLRTALRALENQDTELAASVQFLEQSIDTMEDELREAHIRRLNKGKCHPEAGVAFLDILSNMERIGDHCNDIAGYVLARDKKSGPR